MCPSAKHSSLRPSRGTAGTNCVQLHDCKAGCRWKQTKKSYLAKQKDRIDETSCLQCVIMYAYFHVHQCGSAMLFIDAFIFKTDVTRLAVAHSINYLLPVPIICFPLTIALLLTSRTPSFLKEHFLLSGFGESEWV